jgi:hypothetical protein
VVVEDFVYMFGVNGTRELWTGVHRVIGVNCDSGWPTMLLLVISPHRYSLLGHYAAYKYGADQKYVGRDVIAACNSFGEKAFRGSL